MLLISDVHGAWEALRRVAASGGPLLVLGDLVNFVDYRTYEGILSEIYGRDLVGDVSRNDTAVCRRRIGVGGGWVQDGDTLLACADGSGFSMQSLSSPSYSLGVTPMGSSQTSATRSGWQLRFFWLLRSEFSCSGRGSARRRGLLVLPSH